MLIRQDPDAFVAEAEHRTCPFHQAHPHESFAGCTCSAMYRLRPATPEERKASRDRRLREHGSLKRHIASLQADVAARDERVAMLETYIREGEKALVCTDREMFDPPCGGCDGCLLAQAIYAIRNVEAAPASIREQLRLTP